MPNGTPEVGNVAKVDVDALCEWSEFRLPDIVIPSDYVIELAVLPPGDTRYIDAWTVMGEVQI